MSSSPTCTGNFCILHYMCFALLWFLQITWSKCAPRDCTLVSFICTLGIAVQTWKLCTCMYIPIKVTWTVGLYLFLWATIEVHAALYNSFAKNSSFCSSLFILFSSAITDLQYDDCAKTPGEQVIHWFIS